MLDLRIIKLIFRLIKKGCGTFWIDPRLGELCDLANFVFKHHIKLFQVINALHIDMHTQFGWDTLVYTDMYI